MREMQNKIDALRFNCTFMELKWRITQSRQSALAGFNCTFMELKFSKGFGM